MKVWERINDVRWRICANVLIIWWVCVGLSGCALLPPAPPPPPASEAPSEDKRPEGPSEKPTPRAVAALRLTEQARMLLMNNQPDDAIRLLEQAVNLNPSNGQNFYYLSEAWLTKGNIAQAREFNRLAAVYLEEDPEWTAQVREQQERIERRSP